MPDWSTFPGPKYYEPSTVEPALRALACASSEEEATDANNRVLFAVGNNHAGTLYPAAVAAGPEIVEVTLRGSGWAQHAAFEVLVEGVVFDVEQGFDDFAATNGELVRTREAIDAELAAATSDFLSILRDPAAQERIRVNIMDILDGGDNEGDVIAVLGKLPDVSTQKSFDGARRRFLIEHGAL